MSLSSKCENITIIPIIIVIITIIVVIIIVIITIIIVVITIIVIIIIMTTTDRPIPVKGMSETSPSRQKNMRPKNF